MKSFMLNYALSFFLSTYYAKINASIMWTDIPGDILLHSDSAVLVVFGCSGFT